MIGRRAALLEHLNLAAALLGNMNQHKEEVVAGHVARATARYEDSAMRKHLQRRPI